MKSDSTIAAVLWLQYFNSYLLKNNMITTEEFQKMNIKIQEKASSFAVELSGR